MPLQNKFSKLSLGLLLLLTTQVFANDAPSILSREGWQAKPASAKMQSQKPVAILVHHTGSAQKIRTTLTAKMRGLQRFSQTKEKLADGRIKPAWPDVPYHFYIAADGKIAEGRDINAIGDTNTGYNPSGFIQVVVEGNFETEKLTTEQSTALTTLLQWLTTKYAIKASAVQAHNDKAQTACPGKDLKAKLPAIIAALK
jgi:N-acetyl-anhydromuramyl-L-alanine amidase AmpD